MAMHKASTRRIEVLSRTTGNVDEVRCIGEEGGGLGRRNRIFELKISQSG